MDSSYGERLFEYDWWANQQMLGALKALPNPPAQCLRLMSHIVAAEELWYARVVEPERRPPVWPERTLAECEKALETVHQQWRAYLQGAARSRFTEKIAYRNSKGVHYLSTVEEILTHVVMHGGYHRGQMALLLRQHGIDPPLTDYIAYWR